ARGGRALIAGLAGEFLRECVLDPRRVYVGGLSAGAAAAAVMGATYPDLYAAIGVHSGLACGAASDVSSAFAAMRGGEMSSPSAYGGGDAAAGAPTVPTIGFHRDCDTAVHPG